MAVSHDSVTHKSHDSVTLGSDDSTYSTSQRGVTKLLQSLLEN